MGNRRAREGSYHSKDEGAGPSPNALVPAQRCLVDDQRTVFFFSFF